MKSILQRVRFCGLEPGSPASDPFFGENFNLPIWLAKGRSTYWRSQGPLRPIYDRDGIGLDKSAKISSDTFFNAFFANYWRKLTHLRSLALHLRFGGRLLIQVYAHTDLAEAELLHSCKTQPGQTDFDYTFPAEQEIPHALRLSVSITSLEDGARLFGGEWSTHNPILTEVHLTVAITTFNRKEFAELTVKRILDDSVLEELGVRVLLVDQSDVSELGHLESSRCRVLRQKNLGGAGGFGRAMYESAFGDEVGRTHLLLMDDDVSLDTDSILRVFRMAQFAKAPSVLGGVMLDLYHPHLPHSLGDFLEKIDGFYSVTWHLPGVDLAKLASLNAMSVPNQTDFCSWWFCLMPIAEIKKLQLPIPFFFKLDDLEYGIRAKLNNLPSHTLPGVAVWHIPFYSKMVPWVFYVERYNQLVFQSLLGGPECWRQMHQHVAEGLRQIGDGQVDYGTAMIRVLEDFLLGWKFFRNRTFPTFIKELRASLPPPSKASEQELKRELTLLRENLQALVPRIDAEAEVVQKEFKEKIPLSLTSEAWKCYFETGNMTHLPD